MRKIFLTNTLQSILVQSLYGASTFCSVSELLPAHYHCCLSRIPGKDCSSSPWAAFFRRFAATTSSYLCVTAERSGQKYNPQMASANPPLPSHSASVTSSTFWSRESASLKQGIKTGLAGTIAYAIYAGWNLPQGYWAVFAALVVTQTNLGRIVEGPRYIGRSDRRAGRSRRLYWSQFWAVDR